MGNINKPIMVTPTHKIPRCPMCHTIMESMQLKWESDPMNPLVSCWHEVWSCDSCHSNHVFPARIEFLEMVRNSQLMKRAHRVLHLPRGVG